MTFQEWADQYLETAENIDRRIKELKQEEKTAPPAQLQEYHRRIMLLYGMYLDCMHTADDLRTRKGVID